MNLDHFIYLILLLMIVTVIGSQQARANELIGSSARGSVKGDIIQTAGRGESNIIEVGSITGDNVRNTHVSARVEGNIHARGNIHLSIGSVSEYK